MKKGIYLALITALLSGVSIFVNKFAVGIVKSPIIFTTTKNLIVGLIILAILLISGRWKGIFNINKKQALNLLLVGFIGGAVPFYLFFTGISMIPAINASLIHKTLVIWVALLAMPLLKERLTKIQGLAILLVFVDSPEIR